MRFNGDVVAFDYAGIPMVGNMQTGYAIGLTSEGAEVCARLLQEDVPEHEAAAVDAALFEHLHRGGFFIDAPIASRVMASYLHVTQRCNLSCVGCYSLDPQRNALDDAPLEDILHAVDELASVGVASLVISGGEPFLRSDLPDIVEHAKRAGIAKVTVLSNGTCLSKEALDRLAPYVDCVSVSFDGCSASSTAYIRECQRFDELVDAVGMVRAAGIPAHIIPTVHGRNIGDLAAYLKLADDLGASINFSLLTCEPDDEQLGALLPDGEALRALGQSMLVLGEKKPLAFMDAPVGLNLTVKCNCGAGFRELSVGADGTVYPCHMLQRPELAMGNAFTGTVAEMLQGEVSQRFRALNAETFDGCSSCHYLRICGGGCRARSLFASGNLESRDSYCTMTQAFYDDLGEKMTASLHARGR